MQSALQSCQTQHLKVTFDPSLRNSRFFNEFSALLRRARVKAP